MSNTGFIFAYVKCVSSAGIYYKYLLFYYLQNCCRFIFQITQEEINQNCNTENSREQIKSTKLTIPQISTDHFIYIAFTAWSQTSSPQLNDQVLVLVLVLHIPQKQTHFYKSSTHYEEGEKVNMVLKMLPFFYFQK